jgi:circadian clock protein KaiB
MAMASLKAAREHYVLKLYVSGATQRSRKAIFNLSSICNEYLTGDYEVEVVDIYQTPLRAQEADILAAPTLIRQLPLPTRRIIGDLSERGRVLMLLDIKKKPGTHGQSAKTRSKAKRD